MISTHNQKIKEAFVRQISDDDPKLFITLATNQSFDIDRIRLLVKNYLARINSHFLGSRWSKKSAAERMNGLFFIEGVNTNIHVHGLIDVPYCNKMALRLKSDDVWKMLCPSGSVDVKPVTDLSRLSDYVMKESFKPTFFEEQFFFTAEFMNR